MRSGEPFEQLLYELTDAHVDFLVAGGVAAVLQGAPIVTADLDIVHRRSHDNVDRLLEVLLRLDAYSRLDLANRRIAPTRDLLLGRGHLNLQTSLGPLDVICELGEGEDYDALFGDSVLMPTDHGSIRVLGLARLIQVKAAANRAKDRLVLPILIATLEERAKKR